MPEKERERIRNKIEELRKMAAELTDPYDIRRAEVLINFYSNLLKQSEEVANGRFE